MASDDELERLRKLMPMGLTMVCPSHPIGVAVIDTRSGSMRSISMAVRDTAELREALCTAFRAHTGEHLCHDHDPWSNFGPKHPATHYADLTKKQP